MADFEDIFDRYDRGGEDQVADLVRTMGKEQALEFLNRIQKGNQVPERKDIYGVRCALKNAIESWFGRID